MHLVVLGLSLSSSWGNGHATTFRGLLREFAARGHKVTFLERDVTWYANNRDLPNPSYCELHLYRSLNELQEKHRQVVREADAVTVGSYVPQGIEVGDWALRTAAGPVVFYDIDTPVTLAKLERSDYEYLEPSLIGRYAAYLSFSGGPTLERLEREFGSPMARPLYCSYDPALYYPEQEETRWDLGYMGTYSDDRQPPLDRLMLEAAREWAEGRFVVAGPQYPATIAWPENVERIEHLPPACHRRFYNAQRYTLNITRADMVRAGYSPSVRLFEAAACGTPIISDTWEGLDTFFQIGREIHVSRSPHETLDILWNESEAERLAMAERARDRVLSAHTAAHRAAELEQWLTEARSMVGYRARML